MEALKIRRIRIDMLFVCKLIHNLVKCNLNEYTLLYSNVHNTRGNCFKLNKTHYNLIISQNHFVNRYVNNWNLLRDNILCAPSFIVFRKHLLLFDKFILRGHVLNV